MRQSQKPTHILQSLLPLFQLLHCVLQVSGGRHKLVFQLDHLFLQRLHLLLGLQQHTVYSHSAEPSPSPPASGWRSSASPGSGRGRSPAAASSSAAPSPPPPPLSWAMLMGNMRVDFTKGTCREIILLTQKILNQGNHNTKGAD